MTTNEYTNIGEPTSGTITSIATNIIEHRDVQYGPCYPTFLKVAEHWSVYLDTDIKASQVCHLMMLFKLVRNEQSGNVDDLVDIAGYADRKNICLWIEEQNRVGDEIEMDEFFNMGSTECSPIPLKFDSNRDKKNKELIDFILNFQDNKKEDQ